MNIELKPIAESKVSQLGGDVCGVLVRKDGKLAAVDEHGRVQWLQDGHGAEPVVDIGTQERDGFWQQPIDKYTQPAQQGSVPVAFGIFYEGVFQEHAWNRDAAEAIALEDYTGLDGVTVEPIYTHAQPAQLGSVPEGWKLVPVEPTAAMISAFEHAPCAENYTDAATWAWEAMLDAAPQPPRDGSGDEH